MKKQLAASLVGILVALFALSGSALATHDKGHGKAGHEEPQARDGGKAGKSQKSGGTKSGGTKGKKARTSDDGQKPYDTNPNDHPSGKDRSQEPGGSGTQGKSQSDPDGMANGGADKPGGTGGFDDDKDGNNGCGNDDDFEDDNNGWCGKPKEAEPNAATQGDQGSVGAEGAVVKNDSADIGSVDAPEEAEVLGTRISNQPDSRAAVEIEASGAGVNPALLPFTGMGSTEMVLLVLAALGLIAAGTLVVKKVRS